MLQRKSPLRPIRPRRPIAAAQTAANPAQRQKAHALCPAAARPAKRVFARLAMRPRLSAINVARAVEPARWPQPRLRIASAVLRANARGLANAAAKTKLPNHAARLPPV